MLAGVTIVDPPTTWIDPDVELEPDSTIHPFTVLRGRTRVAAGAEVGPHVVAIDAEIGPDANVGPFCYLRPGTELGAGAKAGTFVEIKNSQHRGAARRCPTSPTSAMRTSARARTSAAGNITANFPHQPGRPKGRTKIGRNVRTGIHNGFVAPVEVGDDAWIAARFVHNGRCPARMRSRSPARSRSTKRAISVESATTELTRLPGLEVAETEPRGRAASTGSSAGRTKRLMLFSGRSHPALAQRIAEQARHRARRRHAARRSRTARPIAATRSRSAAPISSSCRPARRRSTST